MPAESLKSEKSDPIPIAAWPTLMKNPPNKSEELMKAKKTVMGTKPAAPLEPKIKICICSPTSHAGSFRCHLHRASATHTSCWSVANSNSTLNKLNSKLQGGQPVLSRFGRASSLKLKPFSETSPPG